MDNNTSSCLASVKIISRLFPSFCPPMMGLVEARGVLSRWIAAITSNTVS